MTADFDAVSTARLILLQQPMWLPGPAKRLFMKGQHNSSPLMARTSLQDSGLYLATQGYTACVQKGQGVHIWTKRLQ